MQLKLATPTENQKAARLAIFETLKGFDLTRVELLAVMSYTVGQLIAFQDQTKMSPGQAMELVATNIEQGNAEAIAETFAGISNTPS